MSSEFLLSHPQDIARFARDRLDNGDGVALVFVTAVEGGSVREPGLRMAIGESRDTIGYVSNGCVEADLIATALDVIAQQRPATTAYGRGSGKLDIVLPCGGRVELLIVPVGPAHRPALGGLIAADRRNGHLLVDPAGRLDWREAAFPADTAKWVFPVQPKIRLLLFGAGTETLVLARLATMADMRVELASPDSQTIERAAALGLTARALRGLSAPRELEADRGTAVALMFHDHEWEQRILIAALASPAFYVGALGSFRAHQRRAEALAASGIDAAQIARIKAPIGLVHRLRDPGLLAASVVAEIAAEFQQTFVAF